MSINKKNLIEILNNIKSIALIGASSNPERDSFKVMEFLINQGYEVFPVNPNEINNNILGKKCYSSIEAIKQNIDMVDIFRSKEHVYKITQSALAKGIKVIWTQEGIFDEDSRRLAEKHGSIFVMNECPKKILEN
tara:strand:+ start:45 stop:449 length:405 start_codon:yes stop_codon:yes gene_type:complete